MPSFDIVSEVEMPEARNAVDNATRELETRYDFRGVTASFELKEKDNTVEMKAEAEFQLDQMWDVLISKAAKRNLDPQVFERKDVVHSGKTYSQNVVLKQGIEQDVAKKLVKLLKDSKIKVQASIQGEELRVTGKKRDDLQEAIALIRANDLGQPFQFKNFRD